MCQVQERLEVIAAESIAQLEVGTQRYTFLIKPTIPELY